MAKSENQVEKLVLVVHGVGDPQPGSTLAYLARSLADEDQPLTYQHEAIYLHEPGDRDYFKTFPTHRCRVQLRNHKLELAEVYWGDLSRVCHGWFGAVIGFFQILFGLRFLAYAAGDQPGIFAYWLKRLGRYSERILQGPVMAINFFLALLSVAMVFNHWIWRDSHRSDHWNILPIGVCCVVAMIVSSMGSKQNQSRLIERFCFWLNVTVCFVITVFLAKTFLIRSASDPGYPGLLWYGRMLVCFLGGLWFAEIVLLSGMTACWVAARRDKRVHARSIDVAILLPALWVGLWSHVLILAWLIAADRLEKLVGLNGFREIFLDAVPLLGVQFLMSGFVVISVALVAIRFVLWRSKNTIRDFENGSRPPRLIVNGSVQFVLGLSAVFGAGMVLLNQFNELSGYSYQEVWYGKLLAECNKYALQMMLPAGFLITFLLPKLRPIFGIVLEIVNHFAFRTVRDPKNFSDEDRLEKRQTSERGAMDFFRRKTIYNRMKCILNFYSNAARKNHEPVELVVIAHSQGTMIALDVLNSSDMECLGEFSSVTLVTMGSPFENLYHHYFPHCFPALESDHWKCMESRVRSWTNVFRIDDPVGTEITFPDRFLYLADSQGNSGPRQSGCKNVPVGCRGHVNYWGDREVLGVLRSEVFGDVWEFDNSSLRERRAA